MKKILLIAIVFAGCSPKYTEQKAIGEVDRANAKYPSPVADWLRSKYPCITKSADTIIARKDSIVYIDCPDMPIIVHEPGSIDTVFQTKTKVVRVPVNLPVMVQTITKYIEDSAKIKVMSNENYIIKSDLYKSQGETIRIKSFRDKWRKWCIIFATLFFASVGLRFIKIKLPFLN